MPFIQGALVVLFAALLAGCQSDYEKLVTSEKASGVRKDSLLLGIYLGMTDKDFFDRCTYLNKQQLITQGPNSLSVQYYVPNMKSVTALNFYPFFQDRKIVEMPMLFEYKTWSPWKTEYQSDSLMVDVMDLFNEWYGGDFLKLESKERGKIVYAKVTGNRQVLVYTIDEQFVKAVVSDLSVKIIRTPKEKDPKSLPPQS